MNTKNKEDIFNLTIQYLEKYSNTRSKDGRVRHVEAIWPLGQGTGRPLGAEVLPLARLWGRTVSLPFRCFYIHLKKKTKCWTWDLQVCLCCFLERGSPTSSIRSPSLFVKCGYLISTLYLHELDWKGCFFLFVSLLRFNTQKLLGCSHPANFLGKKEATDMYLQLLFA